MITVLIINDKENGFVSDYVVGRLIVQLLWLDGAVSSYRSKNPLKPTKTQITLFFVILKIEMTPLFHLSLLINR